ncbi:MAG: hypothetical protein FWC41_00535 [Firmicutes bacterium]|nr:hypothetical protein [Bacillota bacterium]
MKKIPSLYERDLENNPKIVIMNLIWQKLAEKSVTDIDISIDMEMSKLKYIINDIVEYERLINIVNDSEYKSDKNEINKVFENLNAILLYGISSQNIKTIDDISNYRKISDYNLYKKLSNKVYKDVMEGTVKMVKTKNQISD